MMITTCKIVVIMLFALFFLSCNCRQMAIEAAQLRTWTLQPDFSGSRAHGVSQDSSVLVGYDNLEAANAKTRGVNDIERKFAEHQGEENTAGTPEEHRSLKRSLLLVSGARPSMKLGSQNKFSGASPMHKQSQNSVRKGFDFFASKKIDGPAKLKYEKPTFHVDYSVPKTHPPKHN